jgi:hypothetical protein
MRCEARGMRRDDVEAEGRTLRAAVTALARPAPTTPIPTGLRTRIVAFATRARRSGWSAAATARTVGVSVGSLRNWRRGAPPATLLPVVIAADPAPAAPLTVVTPSGHRVEGLDVATAAALLRALA